jgi:hypothetical protein
LPRLTARGPARLIAGARVSLRGGLAAGRQATMPAIVRTVTSSADEQLAMLRVKYPAWEIWYVRRVYGPDVWCAKRKGQPVATINTDSPEELVRKIADAETGE